MKIQELSAFSKGIDLSKYGTNNRAFAYEEVVALLKTCQQLGIVVLGGDVYRRVGDELEMTYDNWYCNPQIGDAKGSISVQKALNYIEDYVNQHGLGYYFSLVTE